MPNRKFTYAQLDDVLKKLGFTCERVDPKWIRYEHSESGTEIILADKKPTEMVRPTDAWSAREHLIKKGLIRERELDKLLDYQKAGIASGG